MRINRGKAIRKYLRFFRIVYGLESPYHVILDANFIYYSMKYKVDIMHRLEQQLQIKSGELVLYVTQSALQELQGVPGEHKAKSIEFARRMCTVLDDAHASNAPTATAAHKLTNFLRRIHQQWVRCPTRTGTEAADTSDSNKGGASGTRRYLVATQDKSLRHSLATVPGIPLIYLNQVALVMEQPSDASHSFSSAVEDSKTKATTDSEKAIVDIVNRKRKREGDFLNSNVVGGAYEDPHAVVAEAQKQKQRVKHRAKAANPLASRPPTKGSSSQKKMKAKKFR
jgi:rRNA-processing protein FCF1